MSEIVLIDGGLSTELADMGHLISDSKLWTAKWLIEDPAVLKRAHMNFIESGSKIIETSSYQLSIDNLVQELGVNKEEAKTIIKKSVEIAKLARFDSNIENVLVAGSIGPYGACQCDGSEFDGSYSNQMTIEFLKDWHRPRFECLVEAKCDLLAIETIPSIKEATAILELLSEYPDFKAWLSFSCKDEFNLCNGDSFCKAYNKFKNNPQLIAIGINCTSPHNIESLLKTVNRRPEDKPFIVYSNDGKIWDSLNQVFISTDQGNQIDIVYKKIPIWLSLGVKYIGGCCNIGSKDLINFNKIIERYQNQ